MKTHTEYLGNGIINIHVSFAVKRRNGRKLIITPDGRAVTPPPTPKQDDTLVKALVRAWKWQRLLDDEKYPSIEALAVKENVNPSYVSRLLRLNFLAPDIKLAILEGTQPRTMLLQDLIRKAWPDAWEEQQKMFESA